MKRHWPVGAEVSEAAIDGGRMLYDTLRTSNFSADFFEPEYWRRHDAIEGTALGRGTTWFIRAGDSGFVLRHYRRGGAMVCICDKLRSEERRVGQECRSRWWPYH